MLRHDTEHGQANSFKVNVEMQVSSAVGTVQATYGFEITREAHRRSAPVVRREECRLIMPDGSEEEFTAVPNAVSGTALPFGRISDEDSTNQILHALSKSLGRLFLPAIAVQGSMSAVTSALLAMRFYALEPAALRQIDDNPDAHDELGPRGEHVGQVLNRIATDHPQVKEELDAYVRAIVPRALGGDGRRDGEFSTVQARFWDGPADLPYWEAVNSGVVNPGDPHVNVFGRHQLSDGTVLAAGVLAALFQPGVLDGAISLVGIEEPESAIHPSRVGALFEAAHDAARHTQVIVTTQSSDFLDSEYVDPSHLLVVEMVDGSTRIGPVDEATRRFLTEQPSQLADLHRQGQLRPMPPEPDGVES